MKIQKAEISKKIRLFFIAGILIFLNLKAPVFAQEEKQDAATLLLMAARNAAKAGWTKKAIQRYETYLINYPEDHIVELEFADYLQDKGQSDKAEFHYNILVQKMGSVAPGQKDFAKKLLLSAARNAIKNKNNDRAIEYYKQTLLYDGRDSKVVEEAAGVLAGLERFEEALELCEKVLFQDPQNTEVVALKTNLLVRLKKYAEAEEILAKVPDKENDPKLQKLSADVDAWSGNYDKAIEKYQILLQQFPENRELWTQLIKVLSWARKWPLLLDTIQAGKNHVEITDDIRALLVDAYLSVGKEEKAIDVWKTISRESEVWRTSALTMVDKLLSQRKLAAATNILEKIVSYSKPVPEVYLLAKLAILYAYREMPGKGFEILNQISVSPQSKSILEATKAEIFTLTGRYDHVLSILPTLEGGKEIGLRLQMLELECCYALEKDEMLLEKTSSILQKLPREEMVDRSKVLTLRILSQIRLGLYEEANTEIELLAKIGRKDVCPAILTALLLAAERQPEAYEKANRDLGKLLSELTVETEMVRPQLLDEVTLSAWKIADEMSMHQNPEVGTQLAKAEFKSGNFQQSLKLYMELDKNKKDPACKLGMVECYLNLNNSEEANGIFNEIQLHNLPEKEIARYFEVLVKLKNREALIVGLSTFPNDISQKISMKAIMAIANIQSGDRAIADEDISQYLTNQQENLALFQAIIERIGYFDRERQSQNYNFAKDWLYQAVEQFPGDTGLRYQYAKLLATHNDYELASDQFQVLEKNDPTDVRVIRWLAQVKAWRQEYDDSLKWYDVYLKERPSDFERRREVARVCGWALRFHEANEVYKKLCEDYPEDYETSVEWKAKRNNWLGRKRTAASFYSMLTDWHPENTEALFDLGQMYSQLNLSTPAEEAYNKILVIAPEHNRAQFAQESEQWRRRQSVWLKQSYIHQKGSGDNYGNYEITMFRTDAAYAPARISEAMDLSLGLGHTIFKFTEHGGSSAEHLTLRLNKYFEKGITTYLNGELSTYSEERHETAQFEAGGAYRFYDMFDITVLGGRKDVLQNFNTLENSRGRYYTGGRFAWDVSQRIDILSQVKKYWYNDSNTGIEDYTAIGYKLSLYPKILKIVLETYGFDVHSRKDEYWSPHNYRKYMGGVIWRHYLGKEHFSGAQKMYYEVAVKQGVDSSGVDFTEPKFEFGWDDQRRWNIGLEIKPVRSTVFDEEQAVLFCNIRF